MHLYIDLHIFLRVHLLDIFLVGELLLQLFFLVIFGYLSLKMHFQIPWQSIKLFSFLPGSLEKNYKLLWYYFCYFEWNRESVLMLAARKGFSEWWSFTFLKDQCDKLENEIRQRQGFYLSGLWTVSSWLCMYVPAHCSSCKKHSL